MDKKEYIKKLSQKLEISEEECSKINEILENHFLIGKNNKVKIIRELMNQLSYDERKANKIYDASSSIIVGSIKESVKHPFKDKDYCLGGKCKIKH